MPGAIRDYRDLLVWRQSIELALVCERICDELPPQAGALSHQIRRAANSIHANIAEGNGRASRKEYVRHLFVANASLRELESHLYFAMRRFGERPLLRSALRLCTIVGKLLAGLIRSLRNTR